MARFTVGLAMVGGVIAADEAAAGADVAAAADPPPPVGGTLGAAAGVGAEATGGFRAVVAEVASKELGAEPPGPELSVLVKKDNVAGGSDGSG